jgi:RNA polymerase sigma-70 factor (ECF subfamily)
VDLYSFDDGYVERLRAGDRWTEEHFLRYFSELLLIKLRSRLRTLQAIEDVRQEVFLRVIRALRSPDGLRDGRKLGSFVNSVCNNVLLESFRASGRTEALGEEHEQVPDEAEDIEQALLNGEMRKRVQRVLDRLAPKDQQLLRALFIEERDKDEVCRTFSVDRNYLRVLLHRAKEKFRTEYGSPEVASMQPHDPKPPHETDSGKPSLRH